MLQRHKMTMFLFRTKSTTSFELVSRVVNPDGIPEYGLAFGITSVSVSLNSSQMIQKRRRAREKERSNALNRKLAIYKVLSLLKAGFFYTQKNVLLENFALVAQLDRVSALRS